MISLPWGRADKFIGTESKTRGYQGLGKENGGVVV